jgi:hypothetical protein
MLNDLLKIGPHITVLPVIHGSGDFALEVRRVMLEQPFDVVAVPLPPSFQLDVEQAIEHLPKPTVVVQREPLPYVTEWTPDHDDETESNDEAEPTPHEGVCSYVPIDPCQAVIMAVRIAMGERIPRCFIDLETSQFEPHTANMPDPYALKRVAIERFAAAILPNIERPPEGQLRDRVRHMANQLRKLDARHESVLLVCSVLDWPWIREAYQESAGNSAEVVDVDHDFVEPTSTHELDPNTLIFMLGELPFVTGLYERARSELEDDQNLSIDGVKELLVTARDAYRNDLKRRARKITPHLLARCTKYIRNLSLVESRLTPDLYTIVVAAKQIAGDQYALHVAETARDYPYSDGGTFESIVMGIDEARFANGDTFEMVSRLPGPPMEWRSCESGQVGSREMEDSLEPLLTVQLPARGREY